jgi:hypothetical protein
MQIYLSIINSFYECFIAVYTLLGSAKKHVTEEERENDSEELNYT